MTSPSNTEDVGTLIARLDAFDARANDAKHSPWTHSPQEGAPGHCLQAQVWDENGHCLAVLEPSPVPELATATAAHIAGLHPEAVLTLTTALRASLAQTETLHSILADLLKDYCILEGREHSPLGAWRARNLAGRGREQQKL